MGRLLRYVSYSMGNFANTIAYQAFGNRIQFYYVDVMGLNAAVAGVIWTIYGLWNAINDPLMGQLSDRTRTPIGRRVPYVLFGAVPLGLSFFFARHGYRREGIFFGINGGITKLSFSAQGLIVAAVLSLSGYVSGSDVQPESVAWGVRFLIGVTPIIAALLIAFFMWKYPLERTIRGDRALERTSR